MSDISRRRRNTQTGASSAHEYSAKLASIMVKFHHVPTVSGKVSFSPSLHTVFGRAYRVIEIQNNKAKRVGMITASSPAKIH